MILYHDLIHDDENPGWFVILGRNMNEDDHPVRSSFPMDALQWRAAEFGVPEDDIETLFKMLFAEILDRVNGDLGYGEVGQAIPVDVPADVALQKKQQMMLAVSETQNKVMSMRSAAPPADRSELLTKLRKHLPQGIGGVDLETKKVHVYAARGGTAEHVAVARKALELLNDGATGYAEAALVGGSYLVEWDKKSVSHAQEDVQWQR